MKLFKDLGLIEPILRSIEEEKFENPTEIQEKSLPLILSGRDVLAASATGSGKTLAFGSGIIQKIKRGGGIQSIVMTPTRELAEQVANAIKRFSKYKSLEIVVVYGGVSINPQIRALRTADVVIGTPGRLLDHLSRGTLTLKKIEILVLDEADRMLDMGFLDDVEKIIKECPKQRQTLLFSATISHDIDHIIKRHMVNPARVSAETYVDAKKLTQVYYDVNDGLKFSLLVHLLKKERSGIVMVFCNTRRNTDFVAGNLAKSGVEAMAIHGGFSQARRTSTLEKFHSKKVYVLVCTDVASRGLDVKGVSHIYNYDIPKESKQYIHRIGRTARAGMEGRAINLLSERDHENFTRVLRENDVKITKEDMPYVERVVIKWTGKEKRPMRRGFSRGPMRPQSGRSDFRRRRY